MIAVLYAKKGKLILAFYFILVKYLWLKHLHWADTQLPIYSLPDEELDTRLFLRGLQKATSKYLCYTEVKLTSSVFQICIPKATAS